jgi:peptidoglycan/LPS O-acetylase OafA/YrhL
VVPPPPPIPTERHHGIDALRGAMMLLGVVLHLAINYVEGPEDGTWPFRDPERSPLAGLAVLAIHTFRMPVFFVMSGYFSAMLIERRGAWGYARNRTQRIVLTSFAAWVVLFPLTMLAFVFVRLQTEQVDDATRAALFAAAIKHPWANPGPIHLWFLEVLIIFQALSLPAVALAAMAPAPLRLLAARARHGLFMGRARWLLVPVLAMVTTITMLPMHRPGIETPTSFLVSPPILACYALYFVGGWCIRREAGMVARLIKTGWWHLSLGLGALLIAIIASIVWFAVTGHGQRPAPALLAAAQVTSALSCWLLVLGLIGVAERVLARPRPAVRWLVDASFWIYLVHLPLCVLVPWAVSELPMGALTRFSLSFVIVSALLMLSYEAALMIVAPRRGS